MNFPSQIFFNDIHDGLREAILKKNSLWLLAFDMAADSYYEKVQRAMWTGNLLYLPKQLKRRRCLVNTTLNKDKVGSSSDIY